MKPVWIIDDDRSTRWILEKSLDRENIVFKSFSSPLDALQALGYEVPQVVISDIFMLDRSGVEFMKEIQQSHPLIPVIIMTGYSDLESAVSSFQGGAFEYLPKPFDISYAVGMIRRALEHSQHKSDDSEQGDVAPEIIGQSPAMQEVFRAIGRLSRSHATVLINGETGTGKELVAHALHRRSLRATRPFISINTAAIPRGLLESELFGHERGAFTGANATRQGRFEQAEGGTLFLDEIGDMPMELQTRLLRVLSDGNFYRVGGHQPIKSKVRIITATHQDLENLVRLGQFREDLFHRLNVIRIRLPPLRERREDIPLLASYFLQKCCHDLMVAKKEFGDAAMQHLITKDFSGNVRQLENLCHWLAVMSPSQQIEIADLPPEWRNTSTSNVVIDSDWCAALTQHAANVLQRGDEGIMNTMTAQFERALILQAMRHSKGRRIEASILLGIGRNTLTRKIHELDLDAKY